jgi:tetratricopeptide (TPR) repeat protein
MQDADGQAHSALSYFYLIERRFDEALEAGRQAIANRPSCAYANCFYGNVLHYCGEQDGAIHHVKLAMRVQPLHPPFYLHMLALAYRAKGELDSTVSTTKQALELTPNDLANLIVLTSAYVGLGWQSLAEETAAEIKRRRFPLRDLPGLSPTAIRPCSRNLFRTCMLPDCQTSKDGRLGRRVPGVTNALVSSAQNVYFWP